MNTKQKTFVGVGIAAILLAAFFGPQLMKATAQDSGIAARVDGVEISKKEVLDTIKTLPVQGDLNLEVMYPVVTDQLINEKLLSVEADRANLSQDPEVLKQLEAAKGQIIRTVYLERRVAERVNDDSIKAFYEKLKSENQGREETRATHVLVASEAEALEVIKALDGGADIKALAAERSVDPSAKMNKGDLGYFQKDAMVPEFADAAFGLQPGEYTKTPVKTQFGYHIIKVEDRRAAQVPPLSEVEGAIRNKLTQDALIGLVNELRSKATVEKFDINGKPLPDVAAMDMPAETTQDADVNPVDAQEPNDGAPEDDALTTE